ncbi:hypothetical protein BJ912DRAFT_860647 [Pholiota molesta]|nr:hypothetical protein BJ912DRAFT_860647 [Pholiota molesta]
MNAEDDFPPPPLSQRAPRRSDTEKVQAILRYMAEECNRFSLRQLLEVLFASDDSTLKKSANIFLNSGAVTGLLDVWEKRIPSEMTDWAMKTATKACRREFSWLTDRASQGPHKKDADFLRVPANQASVALLEDFRLEDLTRRYVRVLPKFESLLTGVIGKDDDLLQERKVRGRTLVISMLLNLRSRQTNYHCTINGLVLWNNRAHKRLHQVFNRYAVSASYPFLLTALNSVSKDALCRARAAAADETKVKAFLYDNFNWLSFAWEATATNKNVTHDEVSAILLVLPHGEMPASYIASRERFTATLGSRHRIPPGRALEEISASPDDIVAFRANTILHIQYILADEVKGFHHFRSSLPKFEDPKAITPSITEEYCLPTFDQEQGSTRGNMIVLRHYFLDVLQLPVPIFERVMYFVIGDRLTTVRDRAAQDQRSVDRSQHSIDRLTPFTMTNGLMHSCLNYIDNVGRNAWGGSTADAVSLITLRNELPNRSALNLKKIDYYAWLRFYDVILRALVIKAAMVVTGTKSVSDFGNFIPASLDTISVLSAEIADKFLLSSVDRLEFDGIKTVRGNTESGHAIFLMHDLMLLREMRHAIKHGHPTRIHRVTRFWMPMFYAGGSFNYAHEFMELLHNMEHDWPIDSAQVAFNGMLVNSTGKPGGFKEADIRCEHLNDDIKSHAHGVNATPDSLERCTPALGHVGKLTDQLYQDLGVEEQNQHHAKVSQHKDTEILLKHFIKARIFEFSADKISNHSVIDLFRYGRYRVAGKDGGHAKHLAQHKLRFRTRDAQSVDETVEPIEFLAQRDFTHIVDSENNEIRDVIMSTVDSIEY